jgi:hypothetical protein
MMKIPTTRAVMALCGGEEMSKETYRRIRTDREHARACAMKPIESEKRLWLHVLKQAIIDATRPMVQYSGDSPKVVQASALHWINDKRREDFSSFNHVCATLGFSADAIRLAINGMTGFKPIDVAGLKQLHER